MSEKCCNHNNFGNPLSSRRTDGSKNEYEPSYYYSPSGEALVDSASNWLAICTMSALGCVAT